MSFPSTRLESFPTQDERRSGGKFRFEQPANLDVAASLAIVEKDINEAKTSLERHKADGMEVANAAKIRNYEYFIGLLEARKANLEYWKHSDHRIFGYVYKSSGIRPRDTAIGSRYRMDWALV